MNDMMRIYSLYVLEAPVPLETIVASSISSCKNWWQIDMCIYIYIRERERERVMWAWVWDRVMGLWMGKAAGFVFLSFPMVEGER
jgi:hypothetical protein